MSEILAAGQTRAGFAVCSFRVAARAVLPVLLAGFLDEELGMVSSNKSKFNEFCVINKRR